MSLLEAIKTKNAAKEEKPSIEILEGYTYCTEGNERQFIEELKTVFPEMIPIIKEYIKAGMIDGLRNVSFMEIKNESISSNI